MNIADELERLNKLRKEGTLNEEEFTKAKSRLLGQQSEPVSRAPEFSPSEATDRFFSMQVVVIAAIIFLALIFILFLRHWHFHHHF